MRHFLLFFVLLLATAAQAETYSWTDSAGTVHFSDSPGSVPRSQRKGGNQQSATSADAAQTAVSPAASGVAGDGNVTRQVEGLKERMMNDSGIMALITALQSDPEMQAILSDPAVLSAVQSGDIQTLLHNESFMKLLNNPRVREIQRMLQEGKGR